MRTWHRLRHRLMRGPADMRVRVMAMLLGVVLAGASGSAGAKTFRVNVVADPAQMDPITASELVSGRILRNVYEGFTTTDDAGKNIPALAETWEPLTPGPGFRFHLRQGVMFHTGRPFTARDVKYSLKELLRRGSKGRLAAPYMDSVQGAAEFKDGKAGEISGIKVVDDHTIDIALTKQDV